jgi:hypothetical protein
VNTRRRLAHLAHPFAIRPQTRRRAWASEVSPAQRFKAAFAHRTPQSREIAESAPGGAELRTRDVTSTPALVDLPRFTRLPFAEIRFAQSLSMPT